MPTDRERQLEALLRHSQRYLLTTYKPERDEVVLFLFFDGQQIEFATNSRSRLGEEIYAYTVDPVGTLRRWGWKPSPPPTPTASAQPSISLDDLGDLL